MARIERVSVSPKFSNLVQDSRMVGEYNDCAVKAIALVCDVPYAAAHAALQKHGRTTRKGTAFRAIRMAIGDLGFWLKEWSSTDRRMLIETYPGVHKNLRQITTHHPRRFPKAWAPLKDKRLLLYVPKHVAAFKDGEVHDWTVNTAKRVWMVWEVWKK